MNDFRLDGRLALVTGGSSGIGAACAQALAAQGARVLVGYHRGEARAREVAAGLAGSGHGVLALDLGDTAALEAAAADLAQREARLDLLVNSAGWTKRIAHADLASLTPELFSALLNANVVGPYTLTRALLPLLQASGAGLVVNVSSVSAFTGSGSNIAYCAAKAALDTMAMSMARAFGPAVRFLCVSPAAVDTGFVEGRTHAEIEQKALRTPLGRVVTPADVAAAVLACATHLKTATGTRIVVDGGATL